MTHSSTIFLKLLEYTDRNIDQILKNYREDEIFDKKSILSEIYNIFF